MDLPESPQYIRDIICLGTRRTSRYVFDNCMNDIIAAVQNFNVNGDPIVLADIEGYVQEAQYAFDTLRQKIQQRKYPEDFDALWPFIGIPIHIVSDGLGGIFNFYIFLVNCFCMSQYLSYLLSVII